MKTPAGNEITLSVEWKDHTDIVLTNQHGDTYTSQSEELHDFISRAQDQPKDTNVSQSGEVMTLEAKQFTDNDKNKVYRWAKSIQQNVYYGFDENKKPIMTIPTPEYGMGEWGSNDDTVMVANIDDYIIKVAEHQLVPLNPKVFNLISPLFDQLKSELQQAPQSVEVMTLEECKGKIAEKYNEHRTVGEIPISTLIVLSDEAAELYASQFKSKADELQAENTDLKSVLATHKEVIIPELKNELEQVKAERDAMYEGLYRISECRDKDIKYIKPEMLVIIADKPLQSNKQ